MALSDQEKSHVFLLPHDWGVSLQTAVMIVVATMLGRPLSTYFEARLFFHSPFLTPDTWNSSLRTKTKLYVSINTRV